MAKEVQIAVKMKDLDSESGNNLVFNISFQQLVRVLIEATRKMADDYKSPIRMNAANAYTTLVLLMDALGEDMDISSKRLIEAPERAGKKALKKGEYEKTLKDWCARWRGDKSKKPQKVCKGRKKRVCGKRPSDEQLLEFRKNGAFHKDIAKLYGVDTSTVCGWVKSIKQS